MGARPLAKAFQAEAEESVSIETLVLRAKAGDTRAFETLYRRLVGRIYALSLRMSRDPARAEELTQDVFVRAWKRWGVSEGRVSSLHGSTDSRLM